MKNVKRLLVLLAVGLMMVGTPASALTEAEINMFSQNNILFYDPGACKTGASNLSTYDNIVVGADTSQAERMGSMVKNYGMLAMDLQREWGTPWEVVFAQMEMESNTGTNLNSIAGRVASNGYYNWLGITGGGGSYSEGIPPYQGSDRKWAQFPSIENMIKAWAGDYIARNGYYDAAFRNLDPNSYDLRGFLNDFILVYAPPHENDTSRYITSVIGFIEGPIKTAREEMGWPSSEELARQENIPIGGRHPLGNAGAAEDSSGSSGGCTLLRSAPDYNGSDYQAKLANLHNFSQLGSQGSRYASWKMCEDNPISSISGGGCGVMSLFAAYYMFSGQGLNDDAVLRKLLEVTEADNYNLCNQSDKSAFGDNTKSFTQMSGVVSSDASWDTLTSELDKGSKIIIGSATSYFTRSSGHIMMMDHYNKEKDMIYLFDPAMSDKIEKSTETASRVDLLNQKIAENGSGYLEYYNNNPIDGLYVSRRVVEELIQPNSILILSYDGCYNSGSDICRSTYSGLKSGGMGYSEAVSFMAQYREEAAKKKFGAYGAGYPNGTVIGDGYVGDANCHDGTLNNCVAFSRWFVNNYTTAGPKANATGSGWEYARALINQDGFQDNGQIPVVYAIFSEGDGSDNGHTGVVLGIDESKNEIYIGEAGCSAGFNDTWPGVHIYELSRYMNGSYTYAYPAGKLKL